MTTTTTPNMGMVLPVPGSEPGPVWATELVTALTVKLDAHDHTSGKGVPVPAAGLSINADVPWGQASITTLRSLCFQGMLPKGFNRELYVPASGMDLFYQDGAGRAIQLTANGGLNLAYQAGINGQYATDPAHPSAFYTTSLLRYTFTSDGATPVNLRMGGQWVGVASIGANYAFTDTDCIRVLLVSTSGAYTITLPPVANSGGRMITVKDRSGGGGVNAITVVPPAGGATLDGSASYLINTGWGSKSFVCDGANWFTIS